MSAWIGFPWDWQSGNAKYPSTYNHNNIHDLYTTSHRAAHTGSPMFALNMTVEIPAATHISSLRDEFMEFCDELNLDAIMEPMKVWVFRYNIYLAFL